MKIDKKTIIAILLGVVAIAVVLYQLRSTMSPPSRSVTSTVAKPEAVPSESKSQASKASEEPSLQTFGYQAYIASLDPSDIDFKSSDFRNPMKPLVKVKKTGTSRKSTVSGPATRKIGVGPTNALSLGYTIEGIVWDEASPLALINNQVVGTGDRLNDGSLIVEITPKRVRFTKNGKKYFLEFREE
jgi:hypothetical protein